MKPASNFRNSPQTSDRALWSTSDLANYLRCSDRQVFNLRKLGMPSVLVGGLVRFDVHQVQEWLDRRQERGGKDDERGAQLSDIATSGDEDNADCAAVDLAREFPATR
jgi:hypothetical protein